MTTEPVAERKPPPFLFTHPSREAYLNVLVYGDYGVGKTTFAASAEDVPAMREVLFINAEAGDRALVERPELTIVKINQYSQLARIYEWCVRHCNYRDAGDMEKLAKHEALITGEVPTTPKQFRTVVIDSLTEVQKYLMYQLLGFSVGSQRLDLPPDSPEFKEWGQSSEMIQLLVRSFRDLPMNVVFVVSMQEVEDERKRQLKRLNLPGKLATNVQGFLDVVGYMAKAQGPEGQTLRRLYIASGSTWQAKHRFPGVTVEYIEGPPDKGPTMAMLLALDTNSKPTAQQETPSNGSTAAASPTQPRTAPIPSRPVVRTPVRGTPAGRGPVRTGG